MRFKKLALTTLASISLLGGYVATNTVANAAVTKYSAPKFTQKFYKVKITQKTAWYKVIPGKYEYLNKYKKMGYLKPGQKIWVRARGIAWGWTIGKSYKYCNFKDWQDFSWFSTNLSANTTSHALFNKSVSTGKQYTVVTTKNITLRHESWDGSTATRYLDKKRKNIKAGTRLRIFGYGDAPEGWHVLEWDERWLYPYKTSNWFTLNTKK